MTVPLSRLRDASNALKRADAQRARRIADRDAEIVAALDAGATWVQVQEATGLSPRGLQLAIRRHRDSHETG